MSPCNLIRQRSVHIDSVALGDSAEVESQPELSRVEEGLALGTSRFSVPSAPHHHLSSTARPLWRHRVENFLWLVSAAFIIYYGDFRSNFFFLLLNDPRVRRTPLHLGFACLILEVVVVLHLAVRLRFMDHCEKKFNVIGPDAILAATSIGMAAFTLFSVALWPIWNMLTLPMLFTLFMALVVLIAYLPSTLNIQMDADSLSYLGIHPA